MKNIQEIKIPQLGANDLSVTIIEWNVVSGDYVKKDQLICTIESTKSTFEVESDYEGYIEILYELGTKVEILQTIAIVADDEKILNENKSNFVENKDQKRKEEFNATKKAINKAKELNISLEDIDVDGLIKESDIIEYYNSLDKSNNLDQNSIIHKTVDLVGNSLEAKELMLYSKGNIPHSYIETELEIDDALKFVKKYRDKSSFMTLLALLIKASGESLNKNNYFNSYRDGSEIKLYSAVNIGIVIDLDGKLAVPVLKNVPEMSIDSIVKELLDMRKKLIQNKLEFDKLVDGTFTISALDHTNVSRFYPIIHPKQAAVLGFPGIINKIHLDNGKPIAKKIVNLGLSFDHSFLNASMAIEFLDTISSEIKRIINEN